MSIKVNASLKARAEEASRKASQAVMRELNGAFQQSFTAQAWTWPGTTQRRVGTVGSPRNLIDIGTLSQSGRYEMTGDYSARFSWSANYATAVHEGYRRFRADGGASTWPARPWTSAVLGSVQVPGIKPFPINQRMKDVWLAYFKASGR